MITEASRLQVRLQMSALAANAVAFGALALLAPGVLLLEPEVATAALVESAWTYPIVLGLAAVTTALRIRSLGPALGLLEQDSVDLPGADEGLVRRLKALPLSWVVQLALQAIAVAALTMIPQLRPSLIDAETQGAIVLLTGTVTAATSLPLYVIARAVVGTAIETIPWRVVEDVIRDGEESIEPRARRARGYFWDPSGRVQGRLLYAVALPVALVAFGAALIAHAHVRASEARHRRDDAYTLARGVLESETYAGSRGRAAAIAAAGDLGYQVTIARLPEEAAASEAATLGAGGVRTLRARLDDGTAIVSYQPTTENSASTLGYVIATALAIAVAALVGRFIGKSVASDLHSATREVRLLGSQDVLRGVTRVAGPARFEAVAALGFGIEEVAERFREFARGRQRMIDARESAQRMRDLFLASMSHDLRSPLNGILGFVTLLLKGSEGAPGRLSPAQQESLAIIDRRGRELLELIENILDAAKIEAGKLDLARDWASPQELLGQVVRRGRELAEEKTGSNTDARAVDVVGELQPGIPPMFVDGPRLAQAIINLVANAVKFVDRGVVRIRIAHGHPAAGRPGLKIEVEDQGRGIAEKDLAQIFDAFRQPIRSRRHGGLGLGLSMTRAIVELHGGTIDVSSSPEAGSAFTLWLPLPSPASVERVSVQPSTRAALRVPTPVPGTRAPEFVMERPQARLRTGPGIEEQEYPTVQMPALDVPSRDPDNTYSSARMPAASPITPLPEPPGDPDDDPDFDVKETHRIDPNARPIDRRR